MTAALPLTEKILRSSDKSVELRGINANFGDGYGQRAARGRLDDAALRDSWSITWEALTFAELQSLQTFFYEHGTWGSLSYTPPYETSSKTFRAVSSLTSSFDGLSHWKASVTLKETTSFPILSYTNVLIPPELLLWITRNASNVYSDASSYHRVVINNNIDTTVWPDTDPRFTTAGNFRGALKCTQYPLSGTLSGGLAQQDHTIEAWIYMIDQRFYELQYNEGINFILNFGDVIGSMAFGISSGKLFYRTYEYAGALNDLISIASIPLLQWVHVAVTHEAASGTNKLYINGVLDSTHIQTSSAYGFEAPIVLGGSANSGYNFNGLIAQARITPSSLYTSNFSPEKLTVANSVFFVDATSNTTPFRDTARNVTETNLGNVVQITLPYLAPPFNGISSYLSIADRSDLTSLTQFTLEFTLDCLDQPNILPLILSQNTGWSAGMFILGWDRSFDRPTKLSVHWNDVATYLVETDNLSFNQARTFKLTYDADVAKLYIDNSLVATSTSIPNKVLDLSLGTALVIGGGNGDGTSSYFKGTIDNLKIWDIVV